MQSLKKQTFVPGTCPKNHAQFLISKLLTALNKIQNSIKREIVYFLIIKKKCVVFQWI